MEWLFSLLFYCECGINQYAGQKTLTQFSGVNLLLLELSCLSNIILPYFESASSSHSEITCLVFCNVQYICYLMVLLREVTIHVKNCLWNLVFLRIRNSSLLCGFDWEENPEKLLRQ